MIEPITFKTTHKDFDEMSEAICAWQIEFQKLDANPFNADILQVISADFLLTHASFNGHLKQTGSIPFGFRTIVIPACENFEMLWRNQRVIESDIMVFPKNSELHAFSDPRFDVFTLSFRNDPFNAAFGNIQDEVVRLPTNSKRRLRRLLHGCTKNSDLPALVLQHLRATFSNAWKPSGCNGRSARKEIFQAAERLIDQCRDDPPTIEELCAEIKVSKRTLEYAFAEYLGITPKRFIISSRLNGVRKLLQTGNSGVTDAANAWGFWHMGQFAKDYRKLFGELPSETARLKK